MSRSTPQPTEPDARILDVLFEEGFDPSDLEKLSDADRHRAEATLHLLSRLDRLPESSASLAVIDSLMARVAEAERARTDRMRVPSVVRTTRRLRVPDLITIAAVLLLGIGVGWPLLSAMRSASMREQCERNMSSIHAGLSGYARDNDGRLPLNAGLGSFLIPDAGHDSPATAAVSRGPDWKTYNHGGNLELLRDRDYIGAHCLTCPGCEKDRGAMALRVPAAGQRFTLATMRGILVADANPTLELLRAGEAWRDATSTSSMNHATRGQNVLLDDGAVRWLYSPLLPNGDSIWVPRDSTGRATLAPGALPIDPDDVFVAQ